MKKFSTHYDREFVTLKNLFKRHLNWSLFFGIYAASLVFIFANLIVPMYYSPSLYTTGIIFLIVIMAWLIRFGPGIPTTLWYLKEKCQSESNIFWLFLPFGFLILLNLKNKSMYGLKEEECCPTILPATVIRILK